MIEGLKSHGIKWFDTFDNRNRICENWGNIEGSSPRARLDVALITLKIDKKKGKKLIQEYYDNIENKKPHKEYVKELANRLGVKLDKV